MSRRDGDRERCYRAERASIPSVDVTLTFAEFRDLCSLVALEQGHRPPLLVTYSPRLNGAVACGNRIKVGPSCLTASTALHETAHVLTPADVGHGSLWRETYARLLDRYLSDGAGAAFLATFQAAPARRRFRLEEKVAGVWEPTKDRTGLWPGMVRWLQDRPGVSASSLTVHQNYTPRIRVLRFVLVSHNETP